MPNNLYVAWQDQETRAWHTIGRLILNRGEYEFVFTKGSDVLNSVPRDLFRMDVRSMYRSTELPPLFKNKLPSRSRADFSKLAAWLNLSGDEDEFGLLSKFGLIPGTDAILVYPEPEIAYGRYHLEFFVHGIRHMHKDAIAWCENDLAGSRLLPMLDVQNPVDVDAVALRPESENILVGYVPSFYAADMRRILGEKRFATDARFTIVKCNMDAPSQLRILCRFESAVPQGFCALDTDAHKPLQKAA